MKQVYKEYERAFLLEPTKLTRIVDTIHERLGDRHSTLLPDRFEVFLTGGRHEEMSTVEEVLDLDNSRKRKIYRLVIASSSSVAGGPRPDHEIQVDFGGPKLIRAATGGPDTNTTVVSISVRSDDGGWAGRTLSEVEEQVERTRQGYSPTLVAVLALFAILVLFLSQLPGRRADGISNPASSMWLQKSDLDRLRPMLQRDSVITEQEFRAVVTTQLRNVINAQLPERSQSRDGSRRLLLLAIPLVVVAGCIVTLLVSGYPRSVFLWGDETARYATVVQRRKILWGLIITITLGGVLSQLFYEGVLSFFHRP